MYKLINASSLLCSDSQSVPPLAYCPACLGEVYDGEDYKEKDGSLYHIDCYRRTENNGDK